MFYSHLTDFLPPIIVIGHCLFLFIFKKWLGPIGTFYSSIIVFVFIWFVLFSQFMILLSSGSYCFLDFGRWFFCLNFLDSHLLFCIDFLAIIAAALVSFLTPLALYFGAEYMFRDLFVNRLLYLLNFFAASVILLFFCYDFFLILLAWEMIGLFSLLLVNFYSMRIYTIKAALKTFVYSRVSDMFLFLAFLFFSLFCHTTDLSLIFCKVPFLMFHFIFIGSIGIHFLSITALFIVMSGVIKSAQFCFHVWLPDAMEAPTPASALIHSSTLVIAGIFLILRFAILFEFSISVNYFLIWIGSITLLMAAISAVFQQDIKKLIAYSTISQIGYLVCGCGFGCYEEVLLYLIIHALNKAFLFILAGYAIHFFLANTDMRFMGSLWYIAPDLLIFLLSLSLNLTGLPYSAGFLGKEFLLFQLMRNDESSYIIRTCWFITFFITPIYMFVLSYSLLYGPRKAHVAIFRYVEYPPRLTISSLTKRLNPFRFFQISIIQINSLLSAIIFVILWLLVISGCETLYYLIFNCYNPLFILSTSKLLATTSHLMDVFSLTSLGLVTNLKINITLTVYFAFVFFLSFRSKSEIKSLKYVNVLLVMLLCSLWVL